MTEPWPEALIEREAIAAYYGEDDIDINDIDPDGPEAAAITRIVELAKRRAALDASGLQEANPCDGIFSHKWLDPECVGFGCKSLLLAAERDALQQRNAELVEALERIEKEDQRYIIQDGVYPNELAAGNCSKIARAALAGARGETP